MDDEAARGVSELEASVEGMITPPGVGVSGGGDSGRTGGKTGDGGVKGLGAGEGGSSGGRAEAGGGPGRAITETGSHS